MLAVALEALSLRSVRRVELIARAEFPQVVSWWQRQGFVERARTGASLTLGQVLPVSFASPTADDTRELGRRLAGLLRRGDLIIASGDLGAGKTTLTQGVGEGLDVGGAVISPTFVLSRVHRARGEGPDLVHVDAYRLGSAAELDDLDLDASTDDSVTLVEWGTGIAEGRAADRLEVDIRRSIDPSDETRWIFLNPVGERWRDVRDELEAL
jgi:tRNA threonylcarbamoyladenosine biosynthesis protein TsaE